MANTIRKRKKSWVYKEGKVITKWRHCHHIFEKFQMNQLKNHHKQLEISANQGGTQLIWIFSSFHICKLYNGRNTQKRHIFWSLRMAKSLNSTFKKPPFWKSMRKSACSCRWEYKLLHSLCKTVYLHVRKLEFHLLFELEIPRW